MSEQTLSLIITVAIIALMFAWAPFLNFVCPPCGRALERFRLRKANRNSFGISPDGRRPLRVK
jgi:hypothetical protein